MNVNFKWFRVWRCCHAHSVIQAHSSSVRCCALVPVYDSDSAGLTQLNACYRDRCSGPIMGRPVLVYRPAVSAVPPAPRQSHAPPPSRLFLLSPPAAGAPPKATSRATPVPRSSPPRTGASRPGLRQCSPPADTARLFAPTGFWVAVLFEAAIKDPKRAGE